MVASFFLLLAQKAVIRHVTSRSLGNLAPGYAATPQGFRTYAGLVGNIGLIAIAIDLSTRWAGGVWLVIGAAGVFVIGSVTAIWGEIVTYRRVKR